MNIFGKFTIDRPSDNQLVIYRQPGLLFWLFVFLYFGFVGLIITISIAMFWAVKSPQTLTCRSQGQIVNCNYLIPGLPSAKTIQIKDVKKAIASQKPIGETIVLTSSQPWIALQPTDNNAQNIQQINQALAQLRSQDRSWQLDLYAPAIQWQGLVLLFGSIDLLFFLGGVIMLLNYSTATLELDANRNTITITKLKIWRSHPATFNQLTEADSKRLGYLGEISDRFGIYGGHSNRHKGWKHLKIIRLLFTNRRPLTLTQTYLRNQDLDLVNSINVFIKEHKA